jgi:hypothetical protein
MMPEWCATGRKSKVARMLCGVVGEWGFAPQQKARGARSQIAWIVGLTPINPG